MNWLEFWVRLGTALLLGCLIGFERQWRQRMAGMRTNTLVAVGSALFVILGTMTPGDTSPTRIAAQVVSGIGFLGGGIIIRDGLSVRGLNTAATLWCSAAVGTLSGAGFLPHALVGTMAVLLVNIALRPVAQRFIRQMTEAPERLCHYRLTAVCRAEDEQKMRALLLQIVNTSALQIHSLRSEDTHNPARVELKASLTGQGNDQAALEQLVSRLSLEAGVSAVSWEILKSEEQEEL